MKKMVRINNPFNNPFNNDADEDDRGYNYKNDQAADRVKQTLIVKE